MNILVQSLVHKFNVFVIELSNCHLTALLVIHLKVHINNVFWNVLIMCFVRAALEFIVSTYSNETGSAIKSVNPGSRATHHLLNSVHQYGSVSTGKITRP